LFLQIFNTRSATFSPRLELNTGRYLHARSEGTGAADMISRGSDIATMGRTLAHHTPLMIKASLLLIEHDISFEFLLFLTLVRNLLRELLATLFSPSKPCRWKEMPRKPGATFNPERAPRPFLAQIFFLFHCFCHKLVFFLLL
jgi:hypothetical protein